MIKAVDKTMTIGDIRLLEKRGGRSGEFPPPPRLPPSPSLRRTRRG
jgi:hypothetical protein